MNSDMYGLYVFLMKGLETRILGYAAIAIGLQSVIYITSDIRILAEY